MSYDNVGKVWSADSFEEYLKTLKKPEWVKAVCLHHTASPSLAQRPKGWQIQHIENMKDYYRGMGWKAGPHLYTDEDQVFGMTPLNETGTHAVSFNRSAIGIEALGFYSKGEENPHSGRGLEVWRMTANVARELLKWLELPVNERTVLFHRDDPKTSKDCPGSQVSKEWVISLINQTNILPVVKPVVESPKGQIVPVATTLRAKGYSDAEIKKNLRREGKDYFWLDDHLEFAYYDVKSETTMAPLTELTNIPNKQ